MSNWMLITVAMLYVGAAVNLLWRREYAMALVFGCYAGAQMGLIWAMSK